MTTVAAASSLCFHPCTRHSGLTKGASDYRPAANRSGIDPIAGAGRTDRIPLERRVGMPLIENTRRRDSSASKANSAATRFASAERPGWVRRISDSPMWLPGSYFRRSENSILGKEESFLFLGRSPHFFFRATDEAFRFPRYRLRVLDPGKSERESRVDSRLALSSLCYATRAELLRVSRLAQR